MRPYRAPVTLWAASAVGLVLMLACDGVWDALGLLAASAPIFAMGRAALQDRSR